MSLPDSTKCWTSPSRRGEERVVLWRMRFEPEVSPGIVISEIEANAPHFRLRMEGGDVLLLAGEPAEALDEFVAEFALPGSEPRSGP